MEKYFYSEGYVYKGTDTICKIYGTEKEIVTIGDEIVKNLNLSEIISSLKSELNKWIDGSEKAAGNMRDIGHHKEAQEFDGQNTAYIAVKTYLQENGL